MRLLICLVALLLYAFLFGILVSCVADTGTRIAGLVSLLSFFPNAILTSLFLEERKKSESAAKDIVSRARTDIGGESISKNAIRAWLVANQEWSERTRKLVNRYLNQ